MDKKTGLTQPSTWDAHKELPEPEYIAQIARKRLAAGVLFRDQADRILLLEPTYKWNFEIPGGSVEADESPWAAATRELSEELDWHRPIGKLIVVDFVRPHDSRPEGIVFVFDGGVIDEAALETIKLNEKEVRSAKLYPLAEAKEKVKPLVADRLTSAMAAISRGEVVLCEHGVLIA